MSHYRSLAIISLILLTTTLGCADLLLSPSERAFQKGLHFFNQKDYKTAHDLFQQSAAAGNGAAMNQLGWMNAKGLGVPLDYANAVMW